MSVSIALIVLVVVVLSLSQKSIKVAYVGALSGSSSVNGKGALIGVQMAIDEINANGGIDGKKIELLIRDYTQGEPEAIIKELKDEGVVAILGLELSSIATAILPILNEYEMLGISTGASSITLDDLDDYFVRINLSDQIMMKKFADYATDQLDIQSVQIIHSTNNLAYAQSIANSFGLYFDQKGGDINGITTFDSSPDTKYDDVIQPLLEQTTDGILIVANDFDTATIIQQFRLKGVHSKFLVPAWAKTADFIKYIGSETEDIYFVAIADPNPISEGYMTFATQYKTQFGTEPGYTEIYGYDSMMVLSQGLQLANPIDSVELKNQIISQKNYKSILGVDFNINSYGDVERDVWIVEVKDGAYVVTGEDIE